MIIELSDDATDTTDRIIVDILKGYVVKVTTLKGVEIDGEIVEYQVTRDVSTLLLREWQDDGETDRYVPVRLGEIKSIFVY